MIAVDKGFPKGFAVRFRELERWDPVSFERIIWHWSKELMVEIGSILKPRKEKVNRSQSAFSELQPITIHFDGSLDHRKVDRNREYKMDLFYAHPGDIVVAKIDLKNGAVAIVPMEWKNIVVTSHFAVYEPDRSKLLPEYFQRIIQTTFFKSLLWRNKVGAEGRKEVKLDFFESLHIPLPPLVVQHTILLRWQNVQNNVKSILCQVDHLIKTRKEKFYDDLGITVVSYKNRPKTFAVPWKILERWSASFMADTIIGLGKPPPSSFGYYRLGELATVSYGIQKSPANRPDQHPRPYLRVANVRKGYLDLSEIREINVPDEDMDFYRLEPGDILFVEGNGSRSELGRVAMWNGEIPDCVHQNHLIKVRVNPSRLLPEFAMTWFNTEVGRGHFFRSAKTSSGLGTINSAEVRCAPIPLPPIDVQREIMRHVEEKQAEIIREQKKAQILKASVEQEIEEMILGKRPVPEPDGLQKGTA